MVSNRSLHCYPAFLIIVVSATHFVIIEQYSHIQWPSHSTSSVHKHLSKQYRRKSMNDQSNKLLRLTRKDRDAGAAVLGRAFTEYELLRYYFQDETERHAVAVTFGFVALSVSLKYGEGLCVLSEDGGRISLVTTEEGTFWGLADYTLGTTFGSFQVWTPGGKPNAGLR